MTDEENNIQQWIVGLEDQIIEDKDKVLFLEATSCFKHNLNRAAYITAWIMIIESLKRKINVFSSLGDKRATEALEKIEKAEENENSTDKMIFEESKKCGILANSDISTISYLWQQRCLFVHPYNKHPDEEEVKYIISQGVKLVLAKEVLYSRRFLDELVKDIVDKPYFLPTESDRLSIEVKNIVARTPEALHPFLFKTILYQIGQIVLKEEQSKELIKLRFCLVTLFIKTPIPLDDDEWSLENRVTKFPFECFVGFVHHGTWVKLPLRIQEMLIDYVEGVTDENKLISLKTICKALVEKDTLIEQFKEKYFEKLDSLKYDNVINYYGCDIAVFNRTKSELESYQFNKQSLVIDYLRGEKGMRWISKLSNNKQFSLGQLIKASASGSHFKSQDLVSSIVRKSIVYPDSLKAGLVYSAFVTLEDTYSLNHSFIVDAFKLLDQIEADIQNKVFVKIKKVLKTHNPTSYDKDLFKISGLTDTSKSLHDDINVLNPKTKAIIGNLIEEISFMLDQVQYL